MSNIRIETADWERDQLQLIEVRTRVFVDEQHVPTELEIDGQDPQCRHVKAIEPESGKIIGTARLLPGHHVGRMCVLKPYRNLGIGAQMLEYFIALAQTEHMPFLALNAQISALPFYQKHGFVADSEIFMEAGIPHQHMTLTFSE